MCCFPQTLRSLLSPDRRLKEDKPAAPQRKRVVAVLDMAATTAAAAGEVPQDDETMVDLDDEDNLEIEPVMPHAGNRQAAPRRPPQQEGAPLRMRLTSEK